MPAHLAGGWSFDAELLHAAAQGARIQIENPCRASFSFDHPMGLGQDGLDMTPFHLFERLDRRGLDGELEVGGLEG